MHKKNCKFYLSHKDKSSIYCAVNLNGCDNCSEFYPLYDMKIIDTCVKEKKEKEYAEYRKEIFEKFGIIIETYDANSDWLIPIKIKENIFKSIPKFVEKYPEKDVKDIIRIIISLCEKRILFYLEDYDIASFELDDIF